MSMTTRACKDPLISKCEHRCWACFSYDVIGQSLGVVIWMGDSPDCCPFLVGQPFLCRLQEKWELVGHVGTSLTGIWTDLCVPLSRPHFKACWGNQSHTVVGSQNDLGMDQASATKTSIIFDANKSHSPGVLSKASFVLWIEMRLAQAPTNRPSKVIVIQVPCFLQVGSPVRPRFGHRTFE